MLCSSHSIRVMDCSRVTQSLDSLWFYTNIFTCTDGHVAASSCTDQIASLDRSTVILNQQNDQPENVESMIPRCTKCGGVSTAFKTERVTSKSNNLEMLEKKREKIKRRKKNRSGLHGMKVMLGRLDLGFGVNGLLGFQELCGYNDNMPAVQQQVSKILPPFDDDVAMKKHLRLWAYAVACTVKMKQFEKWQN